MDFGNYTKKLLTHAMLERCKSYEANTFLSKGSINTFYTRPPLSALAGNSPPLISLIAYPGRHAG